MRSFSLTLGAVAMLLLTLMPAASAGSDPVDLYVAHVAAPARIHEGSAFVPAVSVGDAMNASLTGSILVELRIDGARAGSQAIAAKNGVWNATIFLYARAVRGVGLHTYAIAVDPEGNFSDVDRTNNALEGTFEVVPSPDITAKIVSLERVPLFTEVATVRHPLGRFALDFQISNIGPVPAHAVSTTAWLRGGGEDTGGSGSVVIGSWSVGTMNAGGGMPFHIVFDTPGVVGDFTVMVIATDDNGFGFDANSSNNGDFAYAFNIVGGEGGIVVPNGVMLAPDPFTVEEGAQRTALGAVAAGEGAITNIAEHGLANAGALEQSVANTTRSAPSLIDNETRDVESLPGHAPEDVQNATSAAVGVVNATFEDGAGLVETAEANASALAADPVDFASTVLCAAGSTQIACSTLGGDPTFGNFQPCAPSEPRASQGVPQWIAWYAVQAYDRGDLFVPQHPPQVAPWLFPDIPLPLTGPALCHDDPQDAAPITGLSPI